MGRGTARAVCDDDFENMTRELKSSGWDFIIAPAEQKKIDNTGDLPAKVTNKLCLAHIACRAVTTYIHIGNSSGLSASTFVGVNIECC